MSFRASVSLGAALTPLRLTGLAVALLASQACLPAEDALCEACTPGGCGAGLVCAPSAGGRVCVPRGATVAVCRLSPPDASVIADAGPRDAGGPPDAGPLSCPTSTVVTWLPSWHAAVCFTQTEVTVEQFRPCSTSTSCVDPAHFTPFLGSFPECDLDKPGRDEFPMNCIRQAGAESFCRSIGGRLPDADVWRKEASAGGTRTYPWGEDAPTCDLAVMAENELDFGCGTGRAARPCSRPAGNSDSGLCDMAGNVWEMTSSGTMNSPEVCGGSIGTTTVPDYLRADACVEDGALFGTLGFRCVTDFVR